MTSKRGYPSFKGLQPASKRASAAARGASKKADTRCEAVLRRELSRRGIRYRLHAPGLPGRPDIVFLRQQVVVFCDGDFWHGRNLEQRIAKLQRGHNSAYWVAKVRRNVERDQQQKMALENDGWMVLRMWETDILRDAGWCADLVAAAVGERSDGRRQLAKQGCARAKISRL